MTEVASVPQAPIPPIAARLAPPRRRRATVARPRLLQRLAVAGDAPVVVVRAPAGYGKSTLLAQFAAQERRPVAWLSLDERDDDPVVLLGDLAHALARAGVQVDALLARLGAGPAGVVPFALPSLIAALESSDGPTVLIIDDVHRLRSAGACDVLRALCDQSPPDCTLVLSGRTRPRLPLARLRADGRLWELKAGDLRMTAGEGAEMLRTAGVDVEDREGAIVVRRTEGWPAAIYLAGVILRDDQSLGEGAALGPGEADLAEYFREEVLAGATAAQADFLVRTAILDELRPEICDAVLDVDDAGQQLRGLADAELFVAPLDAYGEAYQVHGLFREMLHHELVARERDGARALHLRASAAYRDAGDADRAVRHAIAGGDLESAANFIWQATPGCVSHGRSSTLTRWCEWLGDEALAEHPQAALGRGWAAYEAGDVEDAAHCAALALAGDPAQELEGGTTLGTMGVLLRAALGLHGMGRAIADMRRVDEEIPPESPIRSLSLFVLGLDAALDGRADEAREHLEHAERLAAGALPTGYCLALAQQALLAIEVESWEEADALVARAAAQQHTAGIEDHASQGIVPAIRALLLARRGAGAEALEAADHATRNLLLLRVMLPGLVVETRLVLAWALAKLGEGSRARTLLAESRTPMAGEERPLTARWAALVEQELERCGTDPSAGPALTTAELRTLRYLPTHLSLREIGERLYVTRNTVKTHTISIYRKLEVASRSEAVERGRELGLLEP